MSAGAAFRSRAAAATAAAVAVAALLPTRCGGASLQVSSGGADAGTCAKDLELPCASLGYALSQASDGDVIEILPGTYRGPGNRNLHAGGVADLTIVGTGGRDATVLDLERLGVGFTFDATAGDVLVENLTLTNGFCGAANASGRNGGGFSLVGSNATIRGVAIRDMDCTLPAVEYLDWSGGAIYMRDSTALIEDIRVEDCVANHGGGVAGWGADRSVVRNSVFLRTAGTQWAGTMLMEEDAATEFYNVTFAYGSSGYGAALDDGGTAHPLYKDCIFEYGNAGRGGAAYHYGTSQTRFQNCIFRHNFAETATHYISANTKPDFKNCTWYNNTAVEESGGIRSQYEGSRGTLIFSDCTFVRNVAGTFGGAGTVVAAPGAYLFQNCTFDGNVAERGGGGALKLTPVIGSGDPGSPFAIWGSTFVGNSALYAGGAIEIIAGATGDVEIDMGDCLFEGNLAGSSGGALAIQAGVAVSVNRSIFRANSAGTHGGAVMVKNTQGHAAQVRMESVELEQNSAPVAGGGISCAQDSLSPTILALHDFRISSSEVLGDGAGLHCACAHLTLSQGIFRNNRAVEGNGGAVVLSSNVVCGASANAVVFDNVDFERNYAAVGGGLVFFDHVSPSCSLPLQSDGSLNASDESVWRWSNFNASVQDNVASYGALQATAPAKITSECLSSAGLGGCFTASTGTDSAVTFTTAYPGMEVDVRLSMIDDFGQKIAGENAGSGVQVQVEIADAASRVVTAGLSRFWFDAGVVRTSGLSVLGGDMGDASSEELLFTIPRVLVDYAYLPPGRVHLLMGPCPAGFVGATADGSDYTCRACPSGRFAVRLASACQACEAGTFAESSGSESCTPCPAGHKCPPGASAPIPCQAGQYQASNGSMDCDRCELGKYQPAESAEACVDCPPGKTTPSLGAPFSADCGCPAGSAVGPADVCQTCPKGFDCKMGSNLSAFGTAEAGPVALQPGYMSLADDVLLVFRCLSDAHCPGGGPAQCAPHRDAGSVACGLCERGAHAVDGACVPCGGTSFTQVLPVFAILLIGPLVLVVVASQFNKPWVKQRVDFVHCVVHLGMIVSGLQALGVFAQLNLEWFEPVKSMMRAVSALNFNLDIFSLPCIMGVDLDLVAKYAMQQGIAPICVPILTVAVILHRRIGAAAAAAATGTLASVLNAIGTCFNALFILIFSSSLLPLVCYEHPGGSLASMRSTPSVLCFESDEHAKMVVIMVVVILVVLVPFLAFSVLGTVKLRRLTAGADDGGLFYFAACRFLHSKFTIKAYYFGVLMLLRGCLICVVPIITRDVAMQLTMLNCILCASLCLQVRALPWLSEFSNIIDAGCTVLLLLVLQTGGMAAHVSIQMDTVRLMGTLAFCVFFILSIGSLFVLLVLMAKRRYAPRSYWALICHHKGDASAQTRLLKILLTASTGRDIFVDSDDLVELSTLFEVIRSDTERLVVLLTRDTLRRPWCAGEVYVALNTDVVQVLRVEGDAFLPPTEEQLAHLDDYIDSINTLVNLSQFGVTNQDIAAAFRRLLGPDVPCYRFNNEVRPSDRCDHLMKEIMHSAAVKPTDYDDQQAVQGLSAAVAISVRRQDPEAVAAAKILAFKISKDVLPYAKDGLVQLCDLDVCMVPQVLTRSIATIVVLSAGSLESDEQLMAIVVAMQLKAFAAQTTGMRRRSSDGDSHMMTMRRAPSTTMRRAPSTPADHISPNVIPVALPSFVFPSSRLCDEAVFAAWRGEAADVVRAQQSVRDFFQLIAIPLSVKASDVLLTVQASDVPRRLPRSCAPASKEAVVLAERLGARNAPGRRAVVRPSVPQPAMAPKTADESLVPSETYSVPSETNSVLEMNSVLLEVVESV